MYVKQCMNIWKNFPKYVLFLPPGANIQSKLSFKQSPIKKIDKKKIFQLSFEKIQTMNIKPPKNII